MPMEITSLEKFAEIAKASIECRVKRSKDGVKVKARTKRYLYTFKTTEDKLQEVLSKIACKQVVDVDKKRAEG
ncbi:MAG: 60S ribosomal protein L38 [Acidilobaceae archaeon]|nr:60S ribosomal protein L38 [Acidilobaceae archaeon]MCX8165946.1 60S ribosomal protein L38 [Acidilobaceae archaeon]MDW7974589.1 hypothetical protein [Sulfolobales archaeon]